jgi:hypothetical protein
MEIRFQVRQDSADDRAEVTIWRRLSSEPPVLPGQSLKPLLREGTLTPDIQSEAQTAFCWERSV